MRTILFGGLAALLAAPMAMAHPGGLNAQGCHNNRKTGEYHCHRPQASPPPERAATRSLAATQAPFPNCAAARAAGAAPVRRGDPGYAPWLDGDGDGKGCE
jgi:hypothetical protein